MTLETFLTAYAGANPEAKRAALAAADAALHGRTAPIDTTPIERVIPAAEVARLANLTPRSLRTYARRGALKKARFGQGRRSWGYSESSVREFLQQATA